MKTEEAKTMQAYSLILEEILKSKKCRENMTYVIMITISWKGRLPVGNPAYNWALILLSVKSVFKKMMD